MDICNGIKNVLLANLSEIIRLRNTGSLKSDNTFVSKGDILSQQLITDWIKSNVENSIVISEEASNDLSGIESAEYVITVDPIDGTENFVSGLKEWGCGISVYRNGQHHQSMIILPELDICLTTGDVIERITTSRICGLSSYMTPSDFETLGKDHEYRIMGCCMYNMYNVIKGCYTKFQHLKGCYSWDILPGINLAIEHGLSVIIDGKPYHGEFLLPGIKYRFSVS